MGAAIKLRFPIKKLLL